MQQSSFKKVHSVDYTTAPSSSAALSQPNPTMATATTTTTTTTTSSHNAANARQPPPLVHSVSIVIELAREYHHQHHPSQQQLLVESAPGMKATTDDEDEDECLRSELARRVVIVDEADKILRSRALSAELKVDSFREEATAAAVATPTRAGPPLPPRPANLRSNTISSGAGQPQQPLRRQHRLGSLALATCGSQSGSGSGELAERGELRQLGMRRSTHCQVSFGAPTGSGAGGESAQLEPPIPARSIRPNSGSGSSGLQQPQTQQQQRQRQRQASLATLHRNTIVKHDNNWQQSRRQSLQISLLTGCGPSKSLTEEELRGEREFNEQVRSAKSPELFSFPASATTTTSSQHHHHQTIGSGRCHSVAGAGFGNLTTTTAPAAATTTTASAFAKVLSSTDSHLISQPQQARQRRVSFSSIDPVLVGAELVHNRASFAFYPTSSDGSNNNSDSSKIAHGLVGNEEEEDEEVGAAVEYTVKAATERSHSHHFGSIEAGANGSGEDEEARASKLQQVGDKADSGDKFQTGCKQEVKSDLDRDSSASTTSRQPFARAISIQTPSSISSSGGDKLIERTRKQRASCCGENLNFGNIINKQDALLAKEQHSDIEQLDDKRQTKLISSKMNDNRTSILETAVGAADGSCSRIELSALEATKAQMEAFSAAQSRSDPLPTTTTTATATKTSSTSSSSNNNNNNSRAASRENDDSRVQSIMANAKLRQEEFARLLEEHEEIVNEINRVETKISSSQTSLHKQQQSESK